MTVLKGFKGYPPEVVPFKPKYKVITYDLGVEQIESYHLQVGAERNCHHFPLRECSSFLV